MRSTTAFTIILAVTVSIAMPKGVMAEQSAFPYSLSPVRDAAIGALGLGLYGSSLYFDSVKAAPDMSAVDSSAIPFFDRLYTTSHTAGMGTAADVLMVTTALGPATLIPGSDGRALLTMGVMYAETLGLAYAFDAGVKSLVTRYRPYAYALSPVDFTSSDIGASFVSRHATIAFASAVFAGRVFDKVEPDSHWRTLVWASGLTLATATSVLRVTSGDHFPSDVVAGAAFGALIGYVVPLLHERRASGSGAGAVALNALPGGLLVTLSLE